MWSSMFTGTAAYIRHSPAGEVAGFTIPIAEAFDGLSDLEYRSQPNQQHRYGDNFNLTFHPVFIMHVS